VLLLKIPARTTCPVRLSTAIGTRHTPVTVGFKSVSTVGNIDYPQLFAQAGLVILDHQKDVTIMLQHMSDVDIEIPQCPIIGFIENLKNVYFKEISQIDQEFNRNFLRTFLSQNLYQGKNKRNFLHKPQSPRRARAGIQGIVGKTSQCVHY
jgi:hypothetical protein